MYHGWAQREPGRDKMLSCRSIRNMTTVKLSEQTWTPGRVQWLDYTEYRCASLNPPIDPTVSCISALCLQKCYRWAWSTYSRCWAFLWTLSWSQSYEWSILRNWKWMLGSVQVIRKMFSFQRQVWERRGTIKLMCSVNFTILYRILHRK